MEVTKNICCVKGEGAVNHSSVTRLFKKFCLGGKNCDGQARTGKTKTVYSDIVLLAKVENPVHNSRRVSAELSI